MLNHQDYVEKMSKILGDNSKFELIGPVSSNDGTSTIEGRLKRKLSKFLDEKSLSRTDYDRLRPTGPQRPRLYGLPKTHKPGIPLRPILSMVGSSQHQVAQFLAELLQPVNLKFSKHCVQDSFSFVDILRTSNIEVSNCFICSFDIKSLFTNVPLTEVIDICVSEAYGATDQLVDMPVHVFKELLIFATKDVEFSFNDSMYRQIDGVAMGSPLGPLLANVFVGSLEEKLFDQHDGPLLYKRYVDDVFAIFTCKNQCYDFLKRINHLHASIQFTCEEEINNKIAFLDVQIEKDLKNNKFLTSVFRKNTFTGSYVKWESFCTKRRKVNLVSTLTHRAILLCSSTKLDAELDNIRSILGDNGYPLNLVNSIIDSKLKSSSQTQLGPAKCPVSLHLPFIGNPSHRFEKQISSAVSACFGAVTLRTVFHSKPLLPTNRKDPLPTMKRSKIVYQYTCRCDQRYVGRTGQRLETRVEQHLRKVESVRENQSTTRTKNCDPPNESSAETSQPLLKISQQPATSCRRSARLAKKQAATPAQPVARITRQPATSCRRSARLAKKQAMTPTTITSQPDCEQSSAIAKHLIENPLCAKFYHPGQFKIIATARTDFHLSVLEAVYIQSLKPVLCRQKSFVYDCLLF